MAQQFSTRNYSIQDFANWKDNGELILAPKFQRRAVWTDKARSYLIDTIIRGKPIPKLYMRQEVNPVTRRTNREIVDGQQRLSSILRYLNDGFPILKTHNEEFADKHFSELDKDVQIQILEYELVVDLLENLPDEEIYDIFARLNTYSVPLNPQERRNGAYFGEFKTTVYTLSNEFVSFWSGQKIFSETQILRMAEAEMVSELLIAVTVGIKARSKQYIDKFYSDHDDEFPNRKLISSEIPDRLALEDRFRDTMDFVSAVVIPSSPGSALRTARIIYALFCAIYHLQHGLPDVSWKRLRIDDKDVPKLQTALDNIEDIFERVSRGRREAKKHQQEIEEFDEGNEEFDDIAEYDEDELADYDDEQDENEEEELSGIIEGFDPFYLLNTEERQFYDAYNNRWVHASNRRTRTEFIYKLICEWGAPKNCTKVNERIGHVSPTGKAAAANKPAVADCPRAKALGVA